MCPKRHRKIGHQIVMYPHSKTSSSIQDCCRRSPKRISQHPHLCKLKQYRCHWPEKTFVQFSWLDKIADFFQARAKTGSGKTAAYVLPILQSLLRQKASPSSKRTVCSLVLVPTRELAEQVHKAFISFSSFYAKDVRSVNIFPASSLIPHS